MRSALNVHFRRRKPSPVHADHDHTEIHDQGLQFDLQTLMQRRHALKLLGGAAAFALVGCSDNDSEPRSPGTTVAENEPTSAGSPAATAARSVTAAATVAATVSPIPTQATPASACTGPIPSETAGPFPGDGSNGPNALTQSGIVRSDMRTSLGTGRAAAGVPLTIALTVVDTKNNCAPIPGAAVYAWHCDKDGLYSMYSAGATDETYLRGVQEADANGVVRFLTVFPGAYAGRYPHVHFEVYPTLASATSSANKRATSQLAFPADICQAVYATSGYEVSARNFPGTPLDRDGIFRDGYDLQLAAMSGSISSGLTASLLVGV